MHPLYKICDEPHIYRDVAIDNECQALRERNEAQDSRSLHIYAAPGRTHTHQKN